MPLRKPGHYGTLLRVRKHEEERKSQVLAKSQREIAAAMKDLEDIRARQRKTLEQAGTMAREHLDAEDIRRYYQFERHLARQAVNKDAEIRKLRARAMRERRDLEEAIKQRRMTEKLEEKVKENYIREVGALEQKQTDEIASSYHALNGRNGPADIGDSQ